MKTQTSAQVIALGFTHISAEDVEWVPMQNANGEKMQMDEFSGQTWECDSREGPTFRYDAFCGSVALGVGSAKTPELAKDAIMALVSLAAEAVDQTRWAKSYQESLASAQKPACGASEAPNPGHTPSGQAGEATAGDPYQLIEALTLRVRELTSQRNELVEALGACAEYWRNGVAVHSGSLVAIEAKAVLARLNEKPEARVA